MTACKPDKAAILNEVVKKVFIDLTKKQNKKKKVYNKLNGTWSIDVAWYANSSMLDMNVT